MNETTAACIVNMLQHARVLPVVTFPGNQQTVAVLQPIVDLPWHVLDCMTAALSTATQVRSAVNAIPGCVTVALAECQHSEAYRHSIIADGCEVCAGAAKR